MKDYEIFVESSANIPEHLVQDRNIRVIPYYFSIKGKERPCYEKGVPFKEIAKHFYAEMRAGMEAKTSLISEARFVEELSPTLKAGKDAVVLTIASGISGTYQQALAAKKTLEKAFPARRVYVCDSANASLGQGLLALRAADLRDLGESAETCAQWLKENAFKMNSYVTVEDLKYLRRTGRISMAAAVAGTILGIKPLIRADGSVTNPKMTVYGKARGRKKAISALVDAFDSRAIRPEAQTVAIAHADCEEEATALAEILKEHGAGNVIIEYYDLCTGSHIGPGTIALFFFGEDRRAPGSISDAIRSHGAPMPAPTR
ncbi:MAG: DegV family protein [Clostridia bacterium]|nr:DegV family protein [Clostridia bacterium]